MGMTPAIYSAVSRHFRLDDKDILEFGCQQLSHIFDKESKMFFFDKHGVDNGSYTKVLYEKLGYNYDSVDIDAASILCDLNEALPLLSKEYDIVTNFGTTEHIFNQYLSFCAIHIATKVGGRIFHFLPINHSHHGLFNYSVEFFLSLCYANEYKVIEFKKALLADDLRDYSFCDINENSDKTTYLFLAVEKMSNINFRPAQQISYLPRIYISKLKFLMGDYFEKVQDLILPYGFFTNKSIVEHIFSFESAVTKFQCERVALYCANNISQSILMYSVFSHKISNVFDRYILDTENEIFSILPDIFPEKTYIYIATDKYYDEIKGALGSRKDADNIVIINNQ
ncbi:hypothetical protein [Aeromonas sp. R6-2]|uniref:hypothetical protein n=1 Tax=unclassified Aeromonas TaxID=257493 RepID=UPI0034A236AC